jgi:hypothetical protein
MRNWRENRELNISRADSGRPEIDKMESMSHLAISRFVVFYLELQKLVQRV